MIEVTLTLSERSLVAHIAASRIAVNEAAGVRERKRGYQTTEDINYDGVLGEFCFCKQFNLYPPMDFEPRGGGYDCIYKGYTVDVKTVRNKTPERLGLVVPDYKITTASDIFVLCEALDDRTVRIIGRVSKEELFDPANRRPNFSGADGECYFMHYTDLRPFQSSTYASALP